MKSYNITWPVDVSTENVYAMDVHTEKQLVVDVHIKVPL